MPRCGMGIVEFLVIAVILGLIVWAIWTYTPIAAPIKKLILWAVIVVLVLLLLHALGVIGADVQIPKIR
jgi:hypothetical protein